MVTIVLRLLDMSTSKRLDGQMKLYTLEFKMKKRYPTSRIAN